MNKFSTRRRGYLAAGAMAVAASLTVGIAGPALAAPTPAASHVRPVAPISAVDLTPSQQRALAQLTDTPAKMAAFEQNLQRAFNGVATVGHTPMPSVTKTSGTNLLRPNFAQGWNGHWWMTMSYADAAYGGIAAATAGCLRFLPWYICAPIGAILASWVAGYGRAANHGVWLAIYFHHGRITGGRW